MSKIYSNSLKCGATKNYLSSSFLPPLFLCSCLLILINLNTLADGLSHSSIGYDPYKILGVKRSSQGHEIKNAYKEMARIWHPDKNKDTSTSEKFIEINKAYELLSDPERRRLFDQKGIYEELPNHSKSDYNRFDPIDEILTFTTGGAFHYPFADGIAFLHRQSITSKTFDQNIIPKSHSIPQLLLFYGDYCAGCAKATPAWRSISEELHGIGMDVASVHADRERTIARRMGVSAVPAIVLLIESHPFHYRETVINTAKIISFIRSKLPTDLLIPLDPLNIDIFLNSWQDNRIRVIIFGNLEIIRLRYLILSYQYHEKALFGYVLNTSPESDEICKRFEVSKNLDSILLFKESQKPIASLSMADIPPKLMKDLVENNKFLILPRLSSQTIMDSLCPTESSVFRRRLCVILIARDSHNEDLNKNALRDFASKEMYSLNRVRFAYVHEEKQHDFVSSLLNGAHPLKVNTPKYNLVVIWRQDKNKISYEWIDGGWDGNFANFSAQRLENTLNKLLNEKTSLSFNVEIKVLNDEHAQGLFTKILRKVSLTMDFVRGHITREMLIQATSLVATVLFIIAGGFIMAYLVRLEEESIMAKAKADSTANANERPLPTDSQMSSNNPSSDSGSRNTNISSSVYSTSSELRIYEMRGETYNGLVRLTKPGCRTLLLLLDTETKDIILPKYYRCVWPYRKNKSLQFAYMQVDKGGGLSWYKQVLLLSLSEQRNLQINPRNCVGTVLSLNGYRKYFCMFHHACSSNVQRVRGAYRNGGFLGFESDDSDEDNSDIERGNRVRAASNIMRDNTTGVLFTNHLLDNLSNWLDRLFEGSTHRHHINYWPDFPVNRKIS